MTAPKQLNILVVEDDTATSDVLRTSLVLIDGVDEVVTTDVAEEGLQLAQEIKPDIIIVDSSLSLAGEDLGAQLRALRPKATIILFSGTKSESPWANLVILKDNGGVDAVQRAVVAAVAEPPVVDEEMRRFVHDMRNPIGALIGFVHLIKTQRSRLKPEQFDSIIDGIERSANRLSEILEDFAEKR